MNVKLKVLRKVLEEAIANIDAGNSNHSDKEANVSSTELYNGIMSLHNVFDYVEKQDNKTF